MRGLHMKNIRYWYEKVYYKIIKMKYIKGGNWKEYVAEQYNNQTKRKQSSVSDDSIYPALCAIASEDDLIFKVFRRIDEYYKIVGGGSADQVKRTIEYVDQYASEEYKKWFLKNYRMFDKFGMPFKYESKVSKECIRISPNSALNLWVLMDLTELFDANKMQSVVEIGGGYGGLCSIVLTYYKESLYEVIDLPEVNQLQKRYLQNCVGTDNNVTTTSCFECKEIDKDVMLISNYAFTELSRDIQDIYFENVLSHAKSGYMICDNISNADEKLRGYSFEELRNKIPGSVAFTAYPYNARHKILVWGQDNIPERLKCQQID